MFGVRNDSHYFLNQFVDFCDNFLIPLIKDRGIKNIIHLGDVFDRRKYINFNTLDTFNNHYINPLSKMDVIVDHIAGNHDAYYRSTNDVNALKVIYDNRYPNLNFFWEPLVKTYGTKKILLLPWIPKNQLEEYVDYLENVDAEIIMGHLDLKGFTLFPGHISKEGYEASDLKRFEKVFSGHYHLKQEMGNIYYVGSTYQTIWSDYNTQRGVHLFETESGEIEFIQYKSKMFHKILYSSYNDVEIPDIKDRFVQIIVKDKDIDKKYDDFINDVYDCNPANISIIEDYKNIFIENDSDLLEKSNDTLSFIKNYIDEINEINIGKEELYEYISDLYNEAVSEDLEI